MSFEETAISLSNDVTVAAKEDTTITLSNDVTVPLLGIGTGGSSPVGGYPGLYSHESVVCALKECGIRLIDTATMYKNEHLVAESIKESGVTRKDLFITSKVFPTQYGFDEVKRTVNKSLKDLCLDYIDLYLLHFPICPRGTENPKELIAKSRQALEECYEAGLCKAIGVSNFDESHLNDLEETWTVIPHINQIEIHIYNYPKNLIKFCDDLGTQIMAYAPLARGKALKHPEVIRIAEELNCTESQVVIKWGIQKGFVVIAQSTKADRVREMAQVFHCKLLAKYMENLDGISNQEFYQIVVGTHEMMDKYGIGLPN